MKNLIFAMLILFPAFATAQDDVEVVFLPDEPVMVADDSGDATPVFDETKIVDSLRGTLTDGLKPLESSISGLSTSIQSIASKQQEQSDEIDSLQAKLNALTNRIDSLEAAKLESYVNGGGGECKCEGCLTEDRVRAIVREEIAIALKVRTAEGAIVNRSVSYNPRVGYGEFNLAPGEKLVAVDGVPVQDLRTTVPTAVTPTYYMQAKPVYRGTVAPQPIRIMPRLASPMTRFGTCGPNGCR